MPPKVHLLHHEFPERKLIVVVPATRMGLVRLFLQLGYELIDESRSDELIKTYPRKDWENGTDYTDFAAVRGHGQPGQLREYQVRG